MLNLTKQERQVIFFLISIAFIGLSINILLKVYQPSKSIAYFSEKIGKIDINSADKGLLVSIPGLGEKLASRILEYRQSQSGFSSLEELMAVKGLTIQRYEKIKNYLTLE